MRIADTLLRRGHLSEEALAEAWYTGEHPAHLDTCDLCAERALEMSRWLEQTRDLGISSADEAFPAERLAAQQSQIMRRLEFIERPAKLLSFPRATVSASAETATADHRVSSRWLAAAVAAGLVLGVLADRISLWQPAPQTARTTTVPAAPAPPATTPDRAVDLLFDTDGSQPQIRSLSAIDTLTPQVTVARASNRRR